MRLRRATADFDRAALAFCGRAGYLTEEAWTCLEYAAALAERNAAGDSRKAVEALEKGLPIA